MASSTNAMAHYCNLKLEHQLIREQKRWSNFEEWAGSFASQQEDLLTRFAIHAHISMELLKFKTLLYESEQSLRTRFLFDIADRSGVRAAVREEFHKFDNFYERAQTQVLDLLNCSSGASPTDTVSTLSS